MKQTFRQWQANPAQGAIPSKSPFTDADESYLIEVVTECCIRLESALHTAERYPQVQELITTLADALTSIQQAKTILDDLPAYSDVDGALIHIPNPPSAVVKVINAEVLGGEEDHRGGGR